jgi:hypothetical protein
MMKRILLSLLLVASWAASHGQCSPGATSAFSENFDGTVTMTGTGTPGWTLEGGLAVSNPNSYRGRFSFADTAVLETPSFSTIGNTYVLLDFDQICKVSFFDRCQVEVSIDGGNVWTKLTTAEYLGTGSTFNLNNAFSSFDYPVWDAANDLSTPDNTWWKHELFDISLIAQNQSDVRIRFLMHDYDAGFPNGMTGNYGWILDNIVICMAPCELIKPVINMSNNTLSGTIYNTGPYTPTAIITDANGIVYAEMQYSTTGSAGPFTGGITGTNPCAAAGGGNDGFCFPDIPVANVGDSVCFYILAFDGSACFNGDTSATFCFLVAEGIRPTDCEDFDAAAVWSATTVSGSAFEWGTPNFGTTNSAHSAPNAWDISLNTGYLSGTNTSVLSPVYDFSASCNPSLNFWYNSSIDNGNINNDGVQLQYTLDPSGLTGWTALGTGPTGFPPSPDPEGTNWYNSDFIGAFSSDPTNDGWSGNSGGWIQASYNLKSVSAFPGAAAVRFRFVFKSNSAGEGFSFDDFCVITPPDFDAGIAALVPANNTGVASGQTIPVSVTLTNFGNATIVSTSVTCAVDGVPQFTFPWTGSLGCGQSSAFSVDSIVSPSASFSLCCYVDNALDEDHSNDTTCSDIIIVPILGLSYCDDFDGANAGWTQQIEAGASGTTLWELGLPTTAPTNTTHSGAQAWDINLTTVYDDNATCFLFSPYFDFSSANSATLELWNNYDTETGWDGVTLQYSFDNGTTWNNLGTGPTDPNATNWYDVASFNGQPGTPGWTGASGGWQKSTYKLCTNSDFVNQANPIQMRFRFFSDGIIVRTGFTIDDFCIYSSSTDDIGVAAINSPVSAAPAGSTIPIDVTVCNYGGNQINGFPVTYTINGANPVTFNSLLTLPTCSCITVTLPSFVVPSSNFSICAYTGLLTDADNTNDTTCGNFVSVPTLTPTYCDNFDGANVPWYSEVLAGGAANTNWELGAPNNVNGVTTTAHSAPNAWDINLVSDYTAAADVALYSPYFDFSSVVNATMSFWQNRAIGGFNDGFYLQYTDNNGASWTTLGTVNDTNAINWYNLDPLTNGQPGWNDYSSGQFGTPLWIESQYNLNGFSNSATNIQFRFRFVSGPFATGDGVTLDDFCITVPPAQDAGILTVTTPTGFIGGNTNYNINAVLKNYGSQPFSSTVIKYQTTNGCSGTYNWAGSPLLPNQSLLINNIGTCNSGNTDFGLCVWTELPGDGNSANDSLCKNIDVVPVYAVTYFNPYFENFDTTDGGWTSQNDPNGDPNSIWEWGTPNFAATTGAYSGNTCWDINLNSAYTNNAFCYLYSPYFDLSNAVDARVKFWHNFNCEGGWDGTNLQYSLDGINWNIVGVQNDTCGLNGIGASTWYTDDQLNSSLEPAWEDNSNGWIQATYDLNCKYPFLDNSGVVQFRFQFTSDGSVIRDGYSIDDFEVEVPIPVSIAPQQIQASSVSGGLLLFPGVPIEFKAPIKNKGTNPASTCNATLVIDNNLIVTDAVVFSPSVLKDSIQTHTFSVNPVLSPGFHSVCVYTDQPNGTQDLNVFDDTICGGVTVFDSTTALPYCNDFETGSQWVTANALSYTPTNSWELGTPAQPFLNAAHSGVKAWTLDLNGNYTNFDTAGLFSLVTTNLSNHCYKISFWHQFRMEEFQDGGIVEYTNDLGQTWKQIDFDVIYGNSDNVDYVTALSSVGNINKGFTGNTAGWKYNEKVIRPGVTAPMVIRWRFESDGSRTDEGWSIDDVCIIDLGVCSPLGIDDVTASGLGLGQNYPNPFTGRTTIEYSIPSMGDVQLVITDALGRTLSVLDNKDVLPGDYQFVLNDNLLKPGIYFYTLIFEGEKITKRMSVTD